MAASKKRRRPKPTSSAEEVASAPAEAATEKSLREDDGSLPSVLLDLDRSVSCDEDVSASLAWLSYDRMSYALPTMYVDDCHVMQEVFDVRRLRRGDHCVVGLNPIRKLHPSIDAFFFFCASWHLLRMFHHFIMLDNVAGVSEDGVALREDGRPAMIAEYSNTPMGAIRQMMHEGLRAVLRNPAPFQEIPLHDYTGSLPCQPQDGDPSPNTAVADAAAAASTSGGARKRKKGGGTTPNEQLERQKETQRSLRPFGVFRITQQLSEEQRTDIVREARQQMKEYRDAPLLHNYHILLHNCEHAAFRLGSKRGVSPQVPMMLWEVFRVVVQLVGLGFLWNLGRVRGDCVDDCRAPNQMSPSPCINCAARSMSLWCFHIFATFPVALQVVVHLMRSTVHLTQQRDTVGEAVYQHLLAKEAARAVFVGTIAVGSICVLPQRVMEVPDRLSQSVLVVLFVYLGANTAFSFLSQLFIRACLHSPFGVPVFLFNSARRESASGRRKGT